MRYLLPSLIESLNAALKIIDDAGIELEAVEPIRQTAERAKQLQDIGAEPLIMLMKEPVDILLGETHSDVYFDEDIEGLVKHLKEERETANIHTVEDCSLLSNTLEAVDGYMGYALLSPYESKQLSDNDLI
ncbi:MAG TPA: hypothetical protein PLP63_06700 [Saprospiraceae bacterium]|nr:hypothetical protein [Saprospiraceae bacterium]